MSPILSIISCMLQSQEARTCDVTDRGPKPTRRHNSKSGLVEEQTASTLPHYVFRTTLCSIQKGKGQAVRGGARDALTIKSSCATRHATMHKVSECVWRGEKKKKRAMPQHLALPQVYEGHSPGSQAGLFARHLRCPVDVLHVEHPAWRARRSRAAHSWAVMS